VDIFLLLDHLHTVTVDTRHLLDLLQGSLLQGSLTRAATEEEVPVLNFLTLRHGLGTTLSAKTVITLPIKAVGGEAKVFNKFFNKCIVCILVAFFPPLILYV